MVAGAGVEGMMDPRTQTRLASATLIIQDARRHAQRDDLPADTTRILIAAADVLEALSAELNRLEDWRVRFNADYDARRPR